MYRYISTNVLEDKCKPFLIGSYLVQIKSVAICPRGVKNLYQNGESGNRPKGYQDNEAKLL